MKEIIYSLIVFIFSSTNTVNAQQVIYKIQEFPQIAIGNSGVINDDAIFFIRVGILILLIILGGSFFYGNIKWQYRKNGRKDRW